jgi:hypothetical protein
LSADAPAASTQSRLRAFLRRWWPYLFTSLAPLVLYAPFLLGLRVLYWGTPLLQFYPWRKYALDALLSGQPPLWNPYLGNGAPLLANLQSGVLYPPNWLSLILPLDYSMGWLVALHWIWAGAGMVTLARALGVKPLGQAVAGLAFGLSQYLVARAWFLSINAAVAWVPWLIWAAEACLRALRQQSPHARRYAWLLALFVALQMLAGHAQTAWYTLLLLGAWVGWRYVTFHGRPGVRPLAVAAAHFLPALVGAVGLAALQLLPTAELLLQSPRAAAASYDFVMLYSFSPWRLLGLLAPDLLGNPSRGQFLGYGNYWEDAIYVGMLPLLWALAAVVKGLVGRRRGAAEVHADPAARRLWPLLALICLVTVPLAMGRNTPIFPFLYQHVPTFAMFQAPARMMIWLEFSLALLAGLGASQWQPPPPWARWWLNIGAAGAVSITATAAGVLATTSTTAQFGVEIQTLARAFVVLGITLVLCIALLLAQPSAAGPAEKPGRLAWLLRPSPEAWELFAALFVAGDLIYAGLGLSPGGPPDLYRTTPASEAPLRQALDGHRLLQYPGDEYQVFSALMSFKSFSPPQEAYTLREAQLTDATLLEGISTVNNYEPLVSARFEDFLAVISATQSLNLLHLADVGVLASSTPLKWEPVAHGGPTVFYRVPGQSRRVRVVYSAQRVPDENGALNALAAPDFYPETTAILEPDNSAPAETFPPFPWPSAGAGPMLTPSADAYTVSVSLNQTGWVIVSDTCYPGWVALVDGKPAVLRCADVAFRAVLAPSGDHVIEFRYQPRSWAWGLLVSGLSWLAWLALGALFWLGGRRAGQDKATRASGL